MLYYRASDHADENHYTRPIPLIPVLRADDFSLYALQYTPIFSGTSTETILDLQARGKQFPWDKFEDREYDLEAARGNLVERDTLKPLEVVQREGAGFKVEGRKVSWEKWEMRVGFNYREGLTVHNVRYDGRDIFHRLSVSDMTWVHFPLSSFALSVLTSTFSNHQSSLRVRFFNLCLRVEYNAERTFSTVILERPFTESRLVRLHLHLSNLSKHPDRDSSFPPCAVDLGDVGAGLCANSLDLGCDCLGLIEYLDADLIKSDGTAQKMKNVICREFCFPCS